MNTVDRQKAGFGYVYVALAAVLFAISGTASKFLFHSGLTPYQLIQLRTTLAFACLLVCIGIRHSSLLKIAITDLPYFVALGVLGIGAAQFLYLLAISKINVASREFNPPTPASPQPWNPYPQALFPLFSWVK